MNTINQSNQSKYNKFLIIVSEFTGVDVDRIKLTDSLNDHLGLDSLDIVELVMKIEVEMDILLQEESYEKVITINDLWNMIDKSH